MSLINQILNFGFWHVIIFVVMLTVLVFVHEMGHFLIARRNGVRVEVFSIGFGPELFGFTAASGTRWKFSIIPLGGYVRMFGDTNAASVPLGEGVAMSAEERAVSHTHKRVGQRAAIAVGGPLANFLFAIVVLAVIFATSGQPFTVPMVDEVTPDSAAAAAGFKAGDLVTAIDGHAIKRFEEMVSIVQERPGETMRIDILRDGATQSLTATAGVNELVDRFGNARRIGQLGLKSTKVGVVKHDPVGAVLAAAEETWSLSIRTLGSLGQIVAGTRSTNEIGGVLRIAQMSGDVAKEGFVNLAWLAALLSINLGLINLMPIPVLDGGHLLFCAFEAALGRPLGKRIQEIGSMAGLAAVMALMVFATWNDLVHFRVFAFFASLIG